MISRLVHVVCISMFLVLCSKSLQSTDLGIQKKTCVSVWLLVCSSEVGVTFHYAHMPSKTDAKQRYGETEVVHMYQHDENTEGRSQAHTLTTLCLRTYSQSHTHYTDEPNKEMYTILFTLLHITHTANTRTSQSNT